MSEARPERNGILSHTVTSRCQAGSTRIRVLPPERLDRTRCYRVVYVLPVEPKQECKYGDGLLEVEQLDLHNRYDTMFVAPTFSSLPWYADHPKDPELRQETYLLEIVVPLIEEHYPVQADTAGRLLLGFSKSGWGAFSLLLRHPDIFGKAAAWDAPLMKEKPDQFGMAGVFATQDNFEQYQITRLLTRNAVSLREGNRLVLAGYGNFRQHGRQAHTLMEDLRIPHIWRDGPPRNHDWHSGWVEEVVVLLLETRPGISE